MRRHTWKTYAAWVLLAEGAGALSGWLAREGIALYTRTVTQPPLSPPPAVFPIVWAALYALMGAGAARVSLTPPGRDRSRGLRLFAGQLAFSFFWPILFFSLRAYGPALAWLAILWGLILGMTLAFRRTDRPAALLQIPYLLWVAFAGYLNLGVWLLN